MNDNKMTRVARNLDIIANVCGKILAAAGIICVLIAFLTLVLGNKLLANVTITLDLDFIKFYFKAFDFFHLFTLRF